MTEYDVIVVGAGNAARLTPSSEARYGRGADKASGPFASFLNPADSIQLSHVGHQESGWDVAVASLSA